jgi:DNA-binding NarL/FixJ family response regulator
MMDLTDRALAARRAGDALLAPSGTRRIIEQFAQRPVRLALVTQLEWLTQREREVLTMLARGKSNAELFVSEGTIKTHLSSLLAKLGLRDRVQAVVLAYESGLVMPGSDQLVYAARAMRLSAASMTPRRALWSRS